MIFEARDFVWVYLRKDRFPEKRHSKLLPRGDGPFKVLERINDNAYKIELPRSDYAVTNTFNVADLSPFFGPEGSESRSTLSQAGEDDEDIHHDSTQPCVEQTNNVYKAPMTRARAQRLQHKVNSLLIDYEHTTTKNDLLPNRGEMIVLGFEEYYMDG